MNLSPPPSYITTMYRDTGVEETSKCFRNLSVVNVVVRVVVVNRKVCRRNSESRRLFFGLKMKALR